MPVKDGENFISESIESVLNQTFKDFEVLVFDDGSSDRSLEIIRRYRDKRITIFQETGGYIYNLNRGIEIANGRYLARMDQDDIMYPKKLEMQYELMETKDIDVCSTWVYLFGEKLENHILEKFENEFVKNPLVSLSKVNYIHNSTTLIRKDFLLKNNVKYEHYFPAEDYKFWVEIAKRNGKFYVVPEPLLYYRLSDNQAGTVNAKESAFKTNLIRKEIRDYLLDN